MIIKKCWGDFLSLFAGCSLALAFAPFNIWILAFIAPLILSLLWSNASPGRALWRGFLFGLGSFGCGVYWVFNSIHIYGEASIALSCVITAGFIMILALFPAATGYALNRFAPLHRLSRYAFFLPTLWVVFEMIRSTVFTGFPWLLLGYSQIDSPLKGYGPLLSVYGMSLATISISSLLCFYCIQKRRKQTAYPLLLMISGIVMIGSLASSISWTKAASNPIKVSLVQGNIPQEVKWNSTALDNTLSRYKLLTEAHWDSQVIIWPESAVPLLLQDATTYVNSMVTEAKQHHVSLVFGIPIQALNNPGYYNAVVSTGSGSGVYVKQRLVPFGEYNPLPARFRHYLDGMNVPSTDFIHDQQLTKPLLANHMKFAAYVCYEIAYANLVSEQDDDTGFMLTVTNDAWFGHSIAQAQHFQIAQTRALESSKPLLFVGNTGLTGFIRPDGSVQSMALPYTTTVLTDQIIPQIGLTFWNEYGKDSLLLILVIGLYLGYRQPKA